MLMFVFVARFDLDFMDRILTSQDVSPMVAILMKKEVMSLEDCFLEMTF